MTNLSIVSEILEDVEQKMKEYYSALFKETDRSHLILLGSTLATLAWFIQTRKAISECDLEQFKASKYLTIRKENAKITIPEIEATVKVLAKDKTEDYLRLESAIKAIDRFLVQLSIRIKSMQTDIPNTDNTFRMPPVT